MRLSSLRSSLVAGVALAALSFASSAAQAQLIYSDYATGAATPLDNADDSTTPIAYTFTFYGTTHNTVYLSSNGNLNYINNASFSNGTFPSSFGPTISPLWDDWVFYNGADNIYTKTVNGNLVVTWDATHFAAPNITALFQAVLYSDGVIGFGYDHINNASGTTQGVNMGDGVHYTDGAAYNSATSYSQRFYVYDPTTGNYNAFSSDPRSGVPEPGSVAFLVGMGTMGAGFLARRKRARK